MKKNNHEENQHQNLWFELKTNEMIVKKYKETTVCDGADET